MVIDSTAAEIDSDMAALSFATATRAQPHVESIVQMPDEKQTTIRLTVTNNSPHHSPDGGMTVSFPTLESPDDVERVLDVVVPDVMALHVIPAGGQLYGRMGRPQTASYLMIEAHGPWQARQSRTLEIVIEHAESALPVKYRSALSDEAGGYSNAPASADVADQQGRPAKACLVGSGFARLMAGAYPASDQEAGQHQGSAD